jgi:hypothetical protein
MMRCLFLKIKHGSQNRLYLHDWDSSLAFGCGFNFTMFIIFYLSRVDCFASPWAIYGNACFALGCIDVLELFSPPSLAILVHPKKVYVTNRSSQPPKNIPPFFYFNPLFQDHVPSSGPPSSLASCVNVNKPQWGFCILKIISKSRTYIVTEHGK